ncbi:hypothetical protein WJX72_003817 [[Myrmecia] bisecta]|uniref:Transcription factor IIIC 90kDa subunit N-terminal domain-containing protein n=1 Tax=[Myrmecia] bisecta TaxID=41462 RepID=A0AAW1P3F5_9CHLO
MVEVGLQQRLGDQLAWCRTSNLLAVGLHANDTNSSFEVCILDPSCPEEHFTIHVPRDAASSDRLAWLQWSPPGYARSLLTTLSSGVTYVWTQASSRGAADAVSIDNWVGQRAFSSSSKPVAVQWLEPLLLWTWPALATPQGLQSLESRFRPQQGPETDGGDLHWVRPAVLCCAVITKQGSFEVFWRALSSFQGTLQWRKSPPVMLPVHGPIVTAAVVCGANTCLRMLVTTEAEPNTVSVLEVTGDPTCVSAQGGALAPVQCSQLTTLRPAVGQVLLYSCFLPAAAGASVLLLTRSTGTGAVSLSLYAQQSSPAEWRQLSTHGVLGPSKPVRSFHIDDLTAATTPAAGATEGDEGPATCLCCSADGSVVVVAAQRGSSAQMCTLNAATLQVVEQEHLHGDIDALACSPNAALLAAIHRCSNGVIRLSPIPPPLLRPESSHSDTPAAHSRWSAWWGDRLCWSMLAQTHAWDLTSTLRTAAASGDMPSLQATLRWVDAAVHMLPYNTRHWYSPLWDQLKLLLLVGTPDPTAQAVSQDLCARGRLGMIASGLDQLVPMEALAAIQAKYKGQASGSKPFAPLPADSAITDAWLHYVEQYTLFTLQCVKLWVRQRAAHAAATDPAAAPAPAAAPSIDSAAAAGLGAAAQEVTAPAADAAAAAGPAGTTAISGAAGALADEDLDALPCIRLLADYSFSRHLILPMTIKAMLLRLQMHETPHDRAAAEHHAQANTVQDSIRAVIKHLQGDLESRKEMPGQLSDAEKAAMGGNAAACQAAQDSFEGAFQLHYGRTHGRVRWQALREYVEQPTFPSLPGNPELTKELLRKLADDLGLILRPRSMPKRSGASAATPVKREHSMAAAQRAQQRQQQQLPGGLAPSQLKRKRWQMERDTALGIGMGPALRVTAADVLGGRPLNWRRQPTFASTDGLCFTAELGATSLPGSDEPSLYAQHVKPAWREACPVTGNLWKRIAS